MSRMKRICGEHTVEEGGRDANWCNACDAEQERARYETQAWSGTPPTAEEIGELAWAVIELDPEVCAQLKQAFPVLVDQHDEVLDGRKRLTRDPDWPRRVVEVKDEDQRRRIIMAVNIRNPYDRVTDLKIALHLRRILRNGRVSA